MIRPIHIAKRRDARVAFESRPEREALRRVLPSGEEPVPVRLLKATAERSVDELLARYGAPDNLALAIAEGDPDVDPEQTGRRLVRTRRVFVDSRWNIAYHVNLYRILYGTDGVERERRDLNKLPGNVNAELPLRWSGRLVPKKEALRRFVFTHNYQLRHVDGATFDFLYNMAAELQRSDALALIGAGRKGTKPLLLSRGGQPYRGFLEGRVKGERYCLILRLTDIELKAPTMKIYDERMRALHGYEEGKIDAVDSASSALALSYKKDFLKHFIPITRQQIGRRLTGDRYYVTRKYDGEYAIIFHDGAQTVTINRSGRVRRGIPCIEEAGRLLLAAGIRQAVVPAEIYVEAGQGRGRLNALLASLADRRRIGSLRLAVFDLLETDGQTFRGNYGEVWKRLEAIFSGGQLVHPVEMEVATSAEGVEAIYDDWVEREGGEGLVVRSDGPFVYKVKPRHSLDAVVVGFSEGTGSMKGQVRSLLLALMPAEGRYQVVGRVGSGLTEELRETLYDRFSGRVISSEYIVTDMDYVAFRMVFPDTVIELTAGDLLYETESGPKQNTVLRIEAGAYRIAATVDGVKLLAPVFVRVRLDKRADAGDARLAQIERFTSSFDPATAHERPAPESLPASTLLFREVYLKTLGGKTMVQKFMVWKTNKEQTGEYPAYVLYHINFSPGRAEPLRREVSVSSDPAQIGRMLRQSLDEHVRGGWSKTASFKATPVGDTTETTSRQAEPARKRAATGCAAITIRHPPGTTGQADGSHPAKRQPQAAHRARPDTDICRTRPFRRTVRQGIRNPGDKDTAPEIAANNHSSVQTGDPMRTDLHQI